MNQLSKSVVREIRTLRSEGAGGGRLPPATRWALSNERPYRVASVSQCMSPEMALRVISLPRSKQVAFGEEQSSSGRRNPQLRSKMTTLSEPQNPIYQ